MLTLITIPAAFGLPSGSPFSLKAMGLLALSGLDWQRQDGDPRKAPKGKLPVLHDGAQVIPDSEAIRAHLEAQYGVDFDTGLSAEARATSRALIRMADEHLYFLLVCDRWLDDANWPHVRESIFAAVPKAIRGVIGNKVRKKVRANMWGQGVGRHSGDAWLARAGQDIQAVMALLADKPFLFGAAPTAADASVAPVLAAMAASPTETMLSKRINGDAPLMAYLHRVRSTLYP
jgi:glutathione S-transferase